MRLGVTQSQVVAASKESQLGVSLHNAILLLSLLYFLVITSLILKFLLHSGNSSSVLRIVENHEDLETYLGYRDRNPGALIV